jgi:uncharacterized protein YndB with AHSA1/START domain
MERAMRFLKWLGGLLLGLGALATVGGLLLSPIFAVSRDVFINAPPESVYERVADPRQWKDWSIWNQRDPAMAVTYSGAASGAGAVWAWKSATEGDGRMSFTAVEPGRKVAYDLYFPDFGTTSRGELRFAPEGAGTKVTWTMNGDMGSNPLYHWFALFADRLVGKDFEGGLANLKVLAEGGKPGAAK